MGCGVVGLLWRTGYENGDIKAPLFDDVVPKLKEWKQKGMRIVIYSSGSVAGTFYFSYLRSFFPFPFCSHFCFPTI